jgi:hypothetical protein
VRYHCDNESLRVSIYWRNLYFEGYTAILRVAPLPTRTAPYVSFLVCASVSQSQTALWRRVSDKPHFGTLSRASLSSSQQDAIRTLVKTEATLEGGGCLDEDPTGDWLRSIVFESLSLAPNKKTVLVEAGRGCARSGQGANGEMWIVQFNSEIPVFLASPEVSFEGWLYDVSLQPAMVTGI